MLRRTTLVLVGLTGVLLLVIGTALAAVVAETARGALDQQLQVNTHFDNGGKVKIKTEGPVEIITQRITAEPGDSFGWHSHPGENVNVVKQGTLTLYHDENCTAGIDYGPGAAFATHPDDIHLARNEGEEQLILFATYFAPKTTPETPVRIAQLPPGPECPV